MTLTKRKINWGIFILLLLLVILAASFEDVLASSEDTDVNIYLFWGEGCPHCAVAKPILEEIAASDPRIGFVDFDVYSHQDYVELFFTIGEAMGFVPQGVPTIIVGERYWVGYSEAYGQEIRDYIDYCLETDCPDPAGVILAGGEPVIIDTPESPTRTPDESVVPLEEKPTPTEQTLITPTPSGISGGGENDKTITLPLIGAINLSNQSMLLSTILIGIVDGFNPCSLWVLTMLLAITLNTRSRKKVLIIGFVFIFVSGLIYALFIAGLFTVLRIVSFMGWIQVIVALVALFFALVNIKDYFWYKEGLSFTISDEKKPGIYKGIRRVLKAENSIWGLVAGTVVLAAGVSLVEFSCTAGFPVLWTNLLNSQGIRGLAFLGFLLVYMIIYQINEIVISLVSLFTLRKSKLEEKHGRILKLIGGMLMLILALVMLIDPTIMNQLSNSLIIFGAAFILTGIVLLIHRVILPKFHIKLGSE